MIALPQLHAATTLTLTGSDGTAAGTWMVRDIEPGSASSYPTPLMALDDTLFFHAQSTIEGNGLWRTDGTAAGTLPVRPGFLGGGLTAWNGDVLLLHDDGVHGFEPWITDGTSRGTRLIKDMLPGPGRGVGAFWLPGSRHAWLTANDGIHGFELWRTDGTEAGTQLVEDIVPGPTGSGAWSFTLSNGKAFFIADDGIHGFELWVTDPGASAQPIGHGCGSRGPRETRLSATDPVLGGRMRVSGSKAPPNAAAWLALHPGRPSSVVLPSGCPTHVGLNPAVFISVLPAPDGGWSYEVGIANDPALIGMRATMQAMYVTTAASIEVSNAVFIAVGR